MKFYLLLFISLVSFTVFSQSPPLVNYQGVARNVAGVPIINQNISIKFELLQGSASGAVVYTEQQTVITNSLGLFNTQIGASNPLIGINWQNGPYFLQIGIDAAGGTSYTFLGTQQLVSVPYALFAQKAGSAPSPTVAYVGNVLSVGGNTTTINSGALYSAGNGIDISGGVISNTAVPSITLTGSGLATVSPSVSSIFNINVPPPSLSYTPGVLLLTQGAASSSVGIPTSSTSLMAGNTNMQLIPGLNSYTLSPYSYNLSSNSNTITLSNSPGGSISSATLPVTTITPSNGIAVFGTAPNYTIINTATPSITFTSATMGTIYSGSGGSTGFTIPSPVLSGGSGIAVSGTWPSQTISALSTGSTGAGWSTIGNTGTSASTNFIGTTDNQNLVFRTNNTQQAVITSAGNFGVGVPGPLAKMDISGSTSSVLNVLNTTSGNAITANNNSGTPTIYSKNNGAGSAIEAENTSNGTSLQAYKNTGSGSSAIFSNSFAGNSSPVVNINTSANNNGLNISAVNANAINANNNSGTVPTIVANNSGAGNGVDINMTGSGPTALQINNGHIKSVGISPTYFNNAISGGFTTPTSITILGTDVKGKFSFSTSATGFSAVNNCDVTYNFAKSYSIIPTIVITPTTDTYGLSFIIINATTSSFTIRIYRPSGFSNPATVPTVTFSFNYIILE